MRAKISAHAARYTLRGAAEEPPVEIDLASMQRVLIIAAGKAAAESLRSLLQVVQIPEKCALHGILVAPERPAHLPAGFEFFAGGHPLPSSASFRAAQAVLALLRKTMSSNEMCPAFCFFLLSGGASAMMELPLDPSITLDDTVAFHRALLHSGAPIEQMNCVRKHFSAVKGGRLGQAAATMPCLTLAVWDVPDGRMDVLASGPTLPDPSTAAECREILARYSLMEQFPVRVRDFFLTEIPETPKPGTFTARALTLLSDRDLAAAAKRAAEIRGFQAVIDHTSDNWDYEQATDFLLERLERLREQYGKVCLIAPGEVTVQVPHNAIVGSGGRNQHLALYAATLIEKNSYATAVLSVGSDGIDGNSHFAGAVVDENTLLGPDRHQAALDALGSFDAATFLNNVGATIETGPTGNNLRDLRLFLAQ
jgi:hydroxypyruvate reductase